MPLCCRTDLERLAPCYASVLVFGAEGLAPEIRRTEAGSLSPCVTAWCGRSRANPLPRRSARPRLSATAGRGRCDRAYMLNTDAWAFPSMSAYRTHQLVLRRRLEETSSPSI
jgi:hypothetical protein